MHKYLIILTLLVGSALAQYQLLNVEHPLIDEQSGIVASHLYPDLFWILEDVLFGKCSQICHCVNQECNLQHFIRFLMDWRIIVRVFIKGKGRHHCHFLLLVLAGASSETFL